MKSLIYLLLLNCIVAPAFARIGETPEACIARYGEPTKIVKEESQLIFQKGDFLIVASFFEGKCDMIGMRKVEQDILGTPTELSDNEMEVLREANGGGQTWNVKPVMAISKIWQTADGQILAQYEPLERFLVIFTSACNDRKNAETKAKEQKKLDGF